MPSGTSRKLLQLFLNGYGLTLCQYFITCKDVFYLELIDGLAKMNLNYLGFNCRKTPVALEIEATKF